MSLDYFIDLCNSTKYKSKTELHVEKMYSKTPSDQVKPHAAMHTNIIK